MVAKRDYRFITLDVLELAAQTPDRDLADSLRHLVVAYNALARSDGQRLGRSATVAGAIVAYLSQYRQTEVNECSEAIGHTRRIAI